MQRVFLIFYEYFLSSTPFLYHIIPNICSQGYHLSVLVCKSGKLRGFIFLTHHTKTMSCRTAAPTGSTQSRHTQLSQGLPLNAESCYRWSDPLLLSISILCGFVKKKETLHVTWLQRLLYVSVFPFVLTGLGIGFLTVNAIRNKQWQWQEIAHFQFQYRDLVRKWYCRNGIAELSNFGGVIWPGAMANGLLTPQQALRLQESHFVKPISLTPITPGQTVTYWRLCKWK